MKHKTDILSARYVGCFNFCRLPGVPTACARKLTGPKKFSSGTSLPDFHCCILCRCGIMETDMTASFFSKQQIPVNSRMSIFDTGQTVRISFRPFQPIRTFRFDCTVGIAQVVRWKIHDCLRFFADYGPDIFAFSNRRYR